MTDLRIDPTTRDYLLTDGHLEVENDLATQIYLCLETHRGTRIGDADFGSRLHELAAAGSPARAAARAPAMVREALQPLLDEGSLETVTTQAQGLSDGVLLTITVCGPGEDTMAFELFQEVGP